jgi:hypothetical protein
MNASCISICEINNYNPRLSMRDYGGAEIGTQDLIM